MTRTEQPWDAIEAWWSVESREHVQDLEALRDVFDASNATWTGSPCCFDRDPLLADWESTGPRAGPLRSNQEENWSQWLAHLIHSAPDRFTRELLDEPVTATPRRVRCEVELGSDSDHDRRADVVAEFPTRGVSIEVKIDDEHYAKTPETAHLVERTQRSLDWTHLLLLPAYKHDQLRATVGDRLAESEQSRPTLLATRPDEVAVDVVHWRDVSRALRRTLLAEAQVSPHWQASAYLFVALIEQQLCRFASAGAVAGQLRSEALGIAGVTRLGSIEPGEQRDYLASFLTHDDD